MKNNWFILCFLLLTSSILVAQNPPDGWHFSGAGTGGVTPEGNLYVEVDSQQEETDWIGPALPLEPDGIYRMDFDLRVTPSSATGNVTPGLVNYSVDTKRQGDSWQHEVLTIPAPPEPDRMRMRLGAWRLNGRAEFKAWSLKRVLPVFRDCGNDIALGFGERLEGSTYTFTQQFQNDRLAMTRLLPHLDNIRFNTDRFVFERPGACVTYAIQVPGRKQLGNATLELFINHHVIGTLSVEVSTNGQNWTILDNRSETGSINVTLPPELFPAEVIYFRFLAQNGEASPNLQVNRVFYKALVSGEALPAPAVGGTCFVLVDQADERLAVEFLPMEQLLPGKHLLAVKATNQSDRALQLNPYITISGVSAREREESGNSFACNLAPNESTILHMPYTLPDAGDWLVSLALGGDSPASYTLEAKIHDFQSIGYGALLADDGTAALWSAQAGWHVSRERILPVRHDNALRIQAAANEAEATQLVLTPAHDLAAVTLTASELTGPKTLDASCITILQEYYHYVEQPTDSYGYQGLVPDALPPIHAPLNLAAHLNHPFWVRVKIPAGTPAGLYRGTISVSDATGWKTTVPLEIEVFGFELPERMTLETAFGFDTRNPFLYHKVADEAQKRQLLDLYLQALGDHHLSPYDPAPLDQWTYNIVNPLQATSWETPGEPDREVKFAGEAALKVVDDSPTDNRFATTTAIPLPDEPLRFSCKFRTAEPGQRATLFIMFFDENGKWLPGTNRDFVVTGDGSWQTATGEINAFPAGATSFKLNLNPATWAEDGHTLGTTWFDDLLVYTGNSRKPLWADGFEPARIEDYRIVFDWEKRDAALEEAFRKYHFNTLDIWIEALHAAVEIDGKPLARFGDFLEDTPEFAYLHRMYLHQIQEHLREKGWLGMSYCYWYDEPEEKDYPYVMNGFRKLREGAPDLRRMLTEQVEPALIGGPNLWCPVTYSTDTKTVPERLAVGEYFWWYVCTGPKMPYATLFIDHPATNLRTWLWQTWQYQIQGVLIWATTYWNCDHLYQDALQNPYQDTMSWADGYQWVKPGQRQPWGNGDGRFLYPPLATLDRTDNTPNLDPPVESIRIEMLRDGIEDYEYCVILQRLRDEKRSGLTEEELARINTLLTVPPEISTDLTHFTHSPEPILARRAEIARAISELLRK